MAELAQVLGTLLREVAHSRVISDIFSRDVSLEYEKDKILSCFPVPRVEIREASVQFKFAVNAVEVRKVDRDNIIREGILKGADDIVQDVYTNLVLKHPQSEELQQINIRKKLQLKEHLGGAAREVMVKNIKVVNDIPAIDTALIAKKISDILTRVLLKDEDFKNILIKGTQVSKVKDKIMSIATARLKELPEDLSRQIEKAKRDLMSVDIAVTKTELADVPEQMLSQINIVTEIRNYEWTETEDEEGKMARCLRSE